VPLDRLASRSLACALAAVGCADRKPAPDPRAAALAACADALAAVPSPGHLDGGVAVLLDRCTPCGVSWRPLVALSSYDPDEPPTDLPRADEVLAVLDACGATCVGRARDGAMDLLRAAWAGRTPAAPWKKIADRCDGALRVDAHTRRFARGTWYALDQLTRAVWRDDTPEVELPLPPLSEASTAFALPRVDRVAPWRPRVHVTITEDHVHVGVLPWVSLTAAGPALVPGPGVDYPGVRVEPDQLAAALTDVVRAVAGSRRRADAETRPIVIAPRAMPVARVLERIAGLPDRIHLAATPSLPGPTAWPEPVGAIPVAFAPAGPAVGVPELDLSRPGRPVPHELAEAPLPPATTIVHLLAPASWQVIDLAGALAALAVRGVDTALITLVPLSSP
jgi:hypothetical protein